MWEYKRGIYTDVETWVLRQAICQGFSGGDILFNPNGGQWEDIVTLANPSGYIKEGAE